MNSQDFLKEDHIYGRQLTFLQYTLDKTDVKLKKMDIQSFSLGKRYGISNLNFLNEVSLYQAEREVLMMIITLKNLSEISSFDVMLL